MQIPDPEILGSSDSDNKVVEFRTNTPYLNSSKPLGVL